jgi:phosphonate transport system substrate-binding protein
MASGEETLCVNMKSISIKVISIQSDNAADTCRQIARYVGDRLGIPTEFVDDIPWQEREQLLDAGEAHLGWICGLPYVWKADREPSPIELVAAPVMQHPRYQGRPVYFSDVIVRRESEYRAFADLRGVSWAYNEPHSQSGYNITRCHLAELGESKGYFGRVVEAGSHLRAIEMVLDHRVDAAAIDSTVLELEWRARPELETELRVIASLGPSPIPPWVVTRNLPAELREAIRHVFWRMHESADGREILERGLVKKMVRVEDRDYDPIREMARIADRVIW